MNLQVGGPKQSHALHTPKTQAYLLSRPLKGAVGVHKFCSWGFETFRFGSQLSGKARNPGFANPEWPEANPGRVLLASTSGL